MHDMVLAWEDPIGTIERMASPDVKIISLTITEFGYRVPLTKGKGLSHPPHSASLIAHTRTRRDYSL